MQCPQRGQAVLCLLSGRVGKPQSRVERERNPRLPVLMLECTGIWGREGLERSGEQKKSKKIHLHRHQEGPRCICPGPHRTVMGKKLIKIIRTRKDVGRGGEMLFSAQKGVSMCSCRNQGRLREEGFMLELGLDGEQRLRASF